MTQPAQKPLEEFTCPGHDFAITMFGGACRICRICEASELHEMWMDGVGTPVLVSEICPASQTVLPIFQKITASEFVEDSHLDMRRRAYYRSQGLGMGLPLPEKLRMRLLQARQDGIPECDTAQAD